MLQIGTKAPDFSLPNQDGELFNLSDCIGKNVIIFFYAKDNTAGCSKQAAAYAENYSEFENENTVVIGISKDSVKSHRNFADKYNLPYTLISDTDKEILQKYDVWKEKKMYGKTVMGVVRSSCLIDENGVIASFYEKVKPDVNALQMLEDVKKLNQNGEIK